MSDIDLAHSHYLRALELEEADHESAVQAYEACLAGDCRHLEARINLARLHHVAGNLEHAEKLYRDTDEADATLFFNLAVLLEDQGRDEDAARYYRQAILHDPAMADAHMNLSLLLERTGDSQGAYRHLLAYHRLVAALAESQDSVAGE